ncbi:ABC transporter ATP-binding protein/permease [bacterium]|nr:ABC transporter ATP-binding protein/permease [bacterium]
MMLGGFLALILAHSVELLFPTLVSQVLDQYILTQAIDSKYYLYTGIILVIGTLFTYLNTYLNTLLGEKIGQDLKDRLFRKVLKHNYSYLVHNKPSKILTVINSDTIYIKNTFTQFVGLTISSIFLLIGSVVLMFSLNTQLATIIVITVPTVIIILLLLIKDKFKLFKKVQELRDSLNKITSENIKATMLVKVFVSEKTEIKKFKKVNQKNKDIGLEINRIFSLVVPIVNSLAIIATMIIIYFGGKQIIYGDMTIGEVTAFNTYVQLFTLPILMLALMTAMIGQAIASLKRIDEILSAPVTFKDGKLAVKKLETFEVKDLSLKIEDTEILKGVNFEIRRGEKIGIVGLTGSGKTMFLKHLLRALEPTSGEIFLNKHPLKDYKIKDVRNLTGFSFQENFLFNSSVLDNIKFGRNIPTKKVLQVAQIAEADTFVKDMQDGYNSNVGELGGNLSGGEKQRIMIARALAGDPQLLILDDATSRLDIATEDKVFENIRKNHKDISIILVAQKISSVKDCNRIYIFDQGKITEFGTHEELLKHSVLYQEIELSQKNYG